MENDKIKSPIVIILSGGLDSSTMMWYLTKNYKIKEALSFNYGQRHSIETEHAKKVVEEFSRQYYYISHQIVDIENIGKLISKGSLTGSDPIPHDIYDSENQKSTIVPNRNMIFLSIAAGRAITLGTENIGYAAHASDYSVYPDCRPEFIEQMNLALVQGNLWNPVKLIAPFQHISKTEIVKIGNELNVPYQLTWSCYEGSNKPCLQCGTCIERTEAFHMNGLFDPALSAEEWHQALDYLNQYKK